MPNVLHIIEYLDLGEASRSTIASAKYAAQQGQLDHALLALAGADEDAAHLVKEARLNLLIAPDKGEREKHIGNADIVAISYSNSPHIQAFLRSPLPAMRLIIGYHTAGDRPPRVVPPAVSIMADLNIAGCPNDATNDPFFGATTDLRVTERTAAVYDGADFECVSNVLHASHEGFNVGYIEDIDFGRMHPEFVRMSASIDIPDVSFVICGDRLQTILQQQVQALGALDRFDFKGDVADIASVLGTLDVFGYPLREDAPASALLSLQEVMYSGIATVAFQRGGIQHLICHNDTGLLVRSSEDYKRAIEYLYNNPLERQRLGRNAAEYASRRLGAENAARTLNVLYERLLQQPKRPHAWNCSPETLTPGETKDAAAPSTGRLFVDALGEHAGAFRQSLLGGPAAIEADRSIAATSDMEARAGFLRYRAFDETDPHVRLWAGLIFEQQGNLAAAVSEYAAAIEHGLSDDWRVQWYLGRTLAGNGKETEARRIYASIRAQAPEFDEITGDARFNEKSAPTLSFSIAPNISSQQNREMPDRDYRVTAIVSTYNSEAFIDGCLHDLVSQTLYKKGELEIIVIDACSEQNERAVVERYQAYYDHIYYERTPKRETLYASWNRAIKQARGRYITNANADDRHRHDALETLAGYLDAHPQFALVYPGQIDTSIPNETFDTTRSTKLLNWPPYTYSELERHCIIGSQPIWRRSLHDVYGYFREEFKSAGDYEFWLRIGKEEMFFRYPETLGLYYRNPEGIEHGSDDSKRETLQIWHEYGMFERGIPLILGGRLVTRAQIASVGQPPAQAAADAEKPAFDRLIVRFEEALQHKKYQLAVETAHLALVHYGELPYPHVLLAIALRQMQNYAPALEALHRSIEVAETPEALLELLLLSKETGNAPEAQQTEAYIRQKYPSWNDRLDTLAGIPPERDESDLARPAKVEDLDYSTMDFHDLKRHFEKQLRVDDAEQIERLAQAATRRFPKHHEAWLLRAASHRLNGELDEAQVALQKSLLIQDSVDALLELLQLEIALDNEEAALQIARHVLLHYPDLADQVPAHMHERVSETPGAILFTPEIKNFMPIGRQKTNRLMPEDYCLVSYPQSGAGYMRSLIASTLLQYKGHTVHPDQTPVPIHDVIPDLHLHNVGDTWTRENGLSFRLFKCHDLAGVARQPIIYVLRHPIETLESYYRYHLDKPLLRQNMNVSCDTFCLSKMDEYRAHLAAAIQLRKAMPDNILLVSYESLREAPGHALERAMSFIGLEVGEATMQLAIAHCTYEFNVQNKPQHDAVLLADSDETMLTPETKSLIEEALMPIYREAQASDQILPVSIP